MSLLAVGLVYVALVCVVPAGFTFVVGDVAVVDMARSLYEMVVCPLLVLPISVWCILVVVIVGTCPKLVFLPGS